MRIIGKINKIKKDFKNIEDYDNKAEIIVNEFICEYYECGSHQMKLLITIDKEKLIEFFKQFDIEEIKEAIIQVNKEEITE